MSQRPSRSFSAHAALDAIGDHFQPQAASGQFASLLHSSSMPDFRSPALPGYDTLSPLPRRLPAMGSSEERTFSPEDKLTLSPIRYPPLPPRPGGPSTPYSLPPIYTKLMSLPSQPSSFVSQHSYHRPTKRARLSAPYEPFPCLITGCGRTFKRGRELEKHHEWHKSADGCKCPFPECDESFDDCDSTTTHYASHIMPAQPRAQPFTPTVLKPLRRREPSSESELHEVDDAELAVFPQHSRASTFHGGRPFRSPSPPHIGKHPSPISPDWVTPRLTSAMGYTSVCPPVSGIRTGSAPLAPSSPAGSPFVEPSVVFRRASQGTPSTAGPGHHHRGGMADRMPLTGVLTSWAGGQPQSEDLSRRVAEAQATQKSWIRAQPFSIDSFAG